MILTSQECIEIFRVLPINYNKIILEHIESGISDTNTIKLRNAMILYALDKIKTGTLDTDKIDSLFDVLYEEFSPQLHIAHGKRASKRQFIQLICTNISNKYPKQGRRLPSLSDTDATALDEFTNETLSQLSRCITPTFEPHNNRHKRHSGKQQKRKATAIEKAGVASKKPKAKKQKRSKLSTGASSHAQDSSALQAPFLSDFNWSFFNKDVSNKPLSISGNDEASTFLNIIPIFTDDEELNLLNLEDKNDDLQHTGKHEETDALSDSEIDSIPTDLKKLEEMAESAQRVTL